MVTVRGWWRKLASALKRTIGILRRRPPVAGGTKGAPVEPLGEGIRPTARVAGSAGDFIDALQHPDPDVRAGAAFQLTRFADSAEGSRPLDGSSGGAPSPGASAVVQALIEALADEDPGVRSAAALSLGEWGAAAAGAVPALIDALAEEDDDVRSSAGIALQDIGSASRQPLQEALSHPDPRVRAEAGAILTSMSGGSPTAGPL